jgi:hypothetical protein
MSTATHFQHIERAPFELGRLLRARPRYRSDPELTDEQRDMAAAAANHANNYSASLLSGLESLGRVLWSAALNEEQQIEFKDFAGVSQLVTSLAVQLQYLDDFRGEAALHSQRGPQAGSDANAVEAA